ncbi:MAG: hypothetical protein RLZZ630_831 [Bacteroidota bacterium]|jgi:hypothetical protein
MRNDSDRHHDFESDEPEDRDEFDFSDETEDQDHSRRRRRKRIKVRKRVRLKRKSNPKKKIRKILEIIAWTVIIIAFIATLVVLISELDFNEKNRKKRTQLISPEPTMDLTEIKHDNLTNQSFGCCRSVEFLA